MIDLLRAFDFWRLVREALRDGECKEEASTFVHPLVRLDRQGEVESIIGIRKVGFHGTWESQLREICERGSVMNGEDIERSGGGELGAQCTLLNPQLSRRDLERRFEISTASFEYFEAGRIRGSDAADISWGRSRLVLLNNPKAPLREHPPSSSLCLQQHQRWIPLAASAS